MRILLAPGAFKGTLTARQVAAAMARGVRRAAPKAALDVQPMSDGGRGYLESLRQPLGLRLRKLAARDPLGRWIRADVGWRGHTVFIESAQVIGQQLVPTGNKNLLSLTSAGLGDLVRACLERGATRVMVGLGDTATVDGGLGAVLAFFGVDCSVSRCRIKEYGEMLELFDSLDIRGVERFAGSCRMVCLCDVSNPLLGQFGAARVFGPQKGAGPGDVKVLERRLRCLAERARKRTGQRIGGLRWGGAAGGIPALLHALVGARLASGAAFVGEARGLPARMRRADLVLTGEGSLDRQTTRGKVVSYVARVGSRTGTPVYALAARVEPVRIPGLTEAFSILDKPGSREKTVAVTASQIARAAHKVVDRRRAGET